MYGTILPVITSSGVHGHREQVLHRAALALARDREPRHHHHRHGQDHAHQPRHDVVLRDRLGVVEPVHAHVERRPASRRARASGPASGPCARPTRRAAHGADERGARGRRIGRVGLEQHRRALAAQQLAREVGRDAHARTAPSPAPSASRRRLLVGQLADDAEVVASSSSPRRYAARELAVVRGR